MKNILLLILCCCFLLIGESCKKSSDPIPNPPYNPVDDLPDAHNSPDRGVFACLVNGEVWKPSWGFNNPGYSYHEPSGGLSIGAEYITANDLVGIGIGAFSISAEGIYQLHSANYADAYYCDDNPSYILDTLSTYQTEIEYFSIDEGIIIGTFEFTAINYECADTVKITAGRFKMTL